MTEVFFSYSHMDEALRDRLETYLAMLILRADWMASLLAPSSYRSGTGIGGRSEDRNERVAGNGFAAAARAWPRRAPSTDSR
jgi:hypothetical protein